ncbi:ATP-binding protein [Actinomadura sp. SCN-SB]|uniref:ATP-binding protein n=1 Tax=Actinomadura sp. SCN-SB TaxID=3373092 RepID=UPI003753BBE4
MSQELSGLDRVVKPARSLVNPLNFLLATRDAGYKSTALVMAELIDNSIQAGARNVGVVVSSAADSRMPVEIAVADDGEGMEADTLAMALTFGGSSRFNDRSSLGRYGMGLPNGTLSRCRRVEVYTWRGPQCLRSVLDLDQITARGEDALPCVEAVARPPEVTSGSGTLVRLLRCDRVEYRRPSALAKKLEGELGRIYRHFLVSGLTLTINGKYASASDPLCLLNGSAWMGGRQFGDTLVYRLSAGFEKGEISVRFSELPVDKWHDLSAEEKRARGITNAPCVSVVRAGREIDRGWFFMGGKRRENYDDWWRCEISFAPVLDELFGITNSKQAIAPRGELLDMLGPDLEPIARALNNRVRRQFEMVRSVAPLGAAEEQAGRVDAALPPMPPRRDAIPDAVAQTLAGSRHRKTAGSGPYQIVITDLPDTHAFDIVVRDGRLWLLLNSRHPLYRDLYGPLAMSESPRDQEVAKQVALAVLAAARAEVGTWPRSGRVSGRRFRQTWADVLATFMNG